jgi:hypothetical protein
MWTKGNCGILEEKEYQGHKAKDFPRRKLDRNNVS